MLLEMKKNFNRNRGYNSRVGFDDHIYLIRISAMEYSYKNRDEEFSIKGNWFETNGTVIVQSVINWFKNIKLSNILCNTDNE
jgi:hypothetical protein